ncbi:MAG: class I SAM-dependent methyltransferase [Thermoguttaceae bacterium]
MKSERIQYGCGCRAPESWLNFDASPTLRFERLPLIGALYTRNAKRFPPNVRYGDITRGLPVKADSCSAIYCSHVLEHLSLDDCNVALQNTFKYLKPGGVFRLVLPDLEQLCRDYLADGSAQAASRFMEESCLGAKKRVRGVRGLLYALLGNSAHLWMWDEKAMTEQLARHGFTGARRAVFGDATDRSFDAVEDPERFHGCLALECRK